MKHKLENPQRIKELNPVETLKKIGLKENDSLCDIGAGTGIFTFAAANQSHALIYAVDLSPEMLAILEEKKAGQKAENVILEKEISKVPSSSCRIALLSTVYHELQDIPEMLRQIRRILTPGGMLAIIEFHPKQTSYGPPLEHRFSPKQLKTQLKENNFLQTDHFDLGGTLYTSVFTPNLSACPGK
ncbi:class I SAM-dependent methyltransferase [Clostridium minihomine]|uniref:class I SAM-dependent methyltransferase n=1 Tax=Clostridium minihomine TaxID=2045012 RepID=UPI000C76AF60|nr:methyltransferase domain-containing protein [Clostridium minihomine]